MSYHYLLDLALILVSTKLLGLLTQRFQMPQVVGALLAGLIATYFDGCGKHVQFNVVDRATLFDAQEHPEDHRDLLVRVAGYSAFFVELLPNLQNEIIKRTENDL